MSMSNPQSTVQPAYLGYDDSARYTGLSRSMLEKIVGQKQLTPRRVGRRVLFSRQDLDQLLEAKGDN